MRDLMRRLEKLEAESPKDRGIVLIRWQGDPYRARFGDTTIEREPAETVEAFERRVIQHMGPRRGYFWMDTR